jgi:hypothetical protein
VARDNFASILAAVYTNVGFHSLWVDPAATTIVTKVQKELSEAYQWSYRKRVTFLQMYAPYAVGTVTLTQGTPTVLGAGTVWTADMVGRAIRLAPEPQYFFIRSLDPVGQTLVLGDYSGTEFPWVLASATAAVYSIFPIQYPLPDQVDLLLLPTRDWPLDTLTVEAIDRIDPLRQSTGRPTGYALSQGRVIGPGFSPAVSTASGPDTLGGGAGQELRTIEFWPIADLAYTMRFPYLRRAIQAPEGTDIPLCPTELVEHAATIRALRYLHVKSGDSRYLEQAQLWTQVFSQELLPKCLMEDTDRFGVPEALSDGDMTVGDDQYARRDWGV